MLSWPLCSPELSPTKKNVGIMEQKIQQIRPSTGEQLESYIRQDWDNIPLPKLQELVSSVSRCLLLLKEEEFLHNMAVPLFEICCSSKWPHFFFLNIAFSQFNHLIWFLCSVVNKLWLNEIYKTLHFVFIYILLSIPYFFEIGVVNLCQNEHIPKIFNDDKVGNKYATEIKRRNKSILFQP